MQSSRRARTRLPAGKPACLVPRGFTLVEMVTVIAIIGTLAGLVLSTFPRIMRNSERVACMTRLQQIGKAMELYTSDNYGRYPCISGDQVLSHVATDPWYYVLRKYGIEVKSLTCPADQNFDPDRYPDEANLTERLAYRSNNMSYGMQYDWKDADGRPYVANPTGGWVGSTPDGIPDVLAITDWRKRRETILAADSDGDGYQDYAIDLTGLRKIGDRHGGWANVLFGDCHVEPRQVMPKQGLDINAEYRCWTLSND